MFIKYGIMRNYSLLIIFGLCCAALHAQQQVVATSGNMVQYTSGSISWTMGEPVIATLVMGDNTLNQGFQQNYLNLKAANINLENEINIWPNPTCNWVTLSVDDPQLLFCQIFDLNGKLLQKKLLQEKTTSISFGDFAPGAYQVKLVRGDKELKSITVIKQ